ncbi:dsDNA nuclease domain-containing protein [Rhizobium sophoriradicis]|uniref:HamA C-terminal domain-containing protein n=1 Tax=Rhizobium sophoriradicis TaxID=1535245 RepID=UPI0016187FCF|nr:dsDNA nuclease domain-containing protein [Rhizobium leguminosarum bv. phaseoli]
MPIISDAGGVAARVGFKFQDHIAAMYVLEMLSDRRIKQVECETSDDIAVLRSRRNGDAIDYVQVKTTDGNSKWSLTEIAHRPVKGQPTSLIEKSLLCDSGVLDATFRLVTSRAPNNALSILRQPIDTRDPLGDIERLATTLYTKYKNTISANGRDLGYWARNTQWEVHSSSDAVMMRNLQTLSSLAEEKGANPTNSHTKEIYNDLLRIVEDAASAPRSNPDAKVITNQLAAAWWLVKIEETQQRQRSTAKPYRTRGERFFIRVHEFREDASRRYASGYDAQYERRVWRGEKLARYLADWVPEVSLKASELPEIDQLNLRRKLEEGFRAIQADRSLDEHLLLGETLLHAVLRHFFASEPIACKIFHRSPTGDKLTKNAHIVHSSDGDQVWLGRTHLVQGTEWGEMLAHATSTLDDALRTEILVEERDIILQLREPQHLLANSLEDALDRGSPIDLLLEVLCLPILIAYESAVLGAGHSADYQQKLKLEVEERANSLLEALPDSLVEVQVHVFLVPVQNLNALIEQFAALVGLYAVP